MKVQEFRDPWFFYFRGRQEFWHLFLSFLGEGGS